MAVHRESWALPNQYNQAWRVEPTTQKRKAATHRRIQEIQETGMSDGPAQAMMQVPGQPVCLITGAATGIGAACALRFAREGWAVAIGNFDDGTRPAALATQAACRGEGASTLVFDADVGVDEDCRRAVDEVAAHWGR